MILSALVVVGCVVDKMTRGIRVAVQGCSAQERTVRALMVPVLVLGGFDKAAAEHSLPGGHS